MIILILSAGRLPSDTLTQAIQQADRRQLSHEEAGHYTMQDRPPSEDSDHFQPDLLLLVGAPRKQANQSERTAVTEAQARLNKRAPAIWRGLCSQLKQAH